VNQREAPGHVLCLVALQVPHRSRRRRPAGVSSLSSAFLHPVLPYVGESGGEAASTASTRSLVTATIVTGSVRLAVA